MKRNIADTVKAYENKYIAQDNDQFYSSDLAQLMEMSKVEGQMSTWELMSNSLNAGFMIGYQAALRDLKKKRN